MDIEFVKSRLLVKYPLFGSVVANSKFISEPSVGTAGTDGENIYYNPNFFESISDDQKTFILAHEICHIAFNHINRSKDKDKKLWNIATDSVVNAFLKQDGLPLVEGVVDIPEAINYDAEEMYKKLLEEKEKNQQNNNQDSNGESNNSEKGKQNQNNQSNGQSNNSENSQSNNSENDKSNSESSSNSKQSENTEKQDENQDVGHDTHSMWEKNIEKNQQDGQSNPDSEEHKDKKNLSDELNQGSDEKDNQQNKKQEGKINDETDKLTRLGEKKVFEQNRIERKKQLEKLRKALASQSHGYGNDTNSEKRNITNIGISNPLIDWRRLLKEAVKYDIDWSYQNAGIEDGVVTAYLEESPRPETEIVLDTSGSIDEGLLRNFLRECKNIFQNSKVKVGCFDTKFYGFTEIKDISDIDNLPFYGGGGTNFDVAVNAFTKRVENKIIFTDGEARIPSTPIDAIWIVFGKTRINPLGGKVIYINEMQLNKLNNYNTSNEAKGRTR